MTFIAGFVIGLAFAATIAYAIYVYEMHVLKRAWFNLLKRVTYPEGSIQLSGPSEDVKGEKK